MGRILFVVNNPSFFLSHRLPLALAARQAGYDVHVATPEGPDARVVREHGFPFHPFLLGRGSRQPASEARSLASLVALYRAVQPSLVHHVTIKPVLYGSIAASVARVPAVVNAVSGLGYVFLAEGRRAAVLRTLVAQLYRLAFAHPNQRVILQNEDDRALLERIAALKPSSARLIRGSGVDLTQFVPTPEPPLDGPLGARGPVVVVPSRLLRHKGIVELVGAARRLRARGVAARFVLAGGQDDANPTCIPRSEVQAWCDEGIVEWWGHRSDMPSVLAQSHIVCLPSYREGLSKALIEAAAAGRPIVTTDTPGCRDVVRDGDNGLLVPIRDEARLAEALERLIVDSALRVSMGARGRERALEEFDVRAVIRLTLNVYAELIGAPVVDTATTRDALARSERVQERRNTPGQESAAPGS